MCQFYCPISYLYMSVLALGTKYLYIFNVLLLETIKKCLICLECTKQTRTQNNFNYIVIYEPNNQ